MEITLVHPDDQNAKVVVSNPIQVAAYRGQGFVEESELTELSAPEPTVESSPEVAEELTQLKAENKALKSENTKLKNKLEKLAAETKPESEEPEGKPEEEEEAK